ncbi:spore germination protein [Brevibacillus humidisoli]|uniref:GerAB/ArcD/ProY family transporter n=1 Tax=Brevibacillus humidisoli TaxID=2895522 RepID=UPI001E4DFF0A|nr:endospore germination permease [Brevibacillus humidisoli]UFJ40825.1 spore germination protein [Brevibacillus humidisoli]
MRRYAYNQLSLTQYIFTIYKTQVGIGVLSLPRDLAETSGADGWIAILLGWMLAVCTSLVVIKVMEKNPQDTLYDLFPKYFGKWIGTGLSVIWILYGLFGASVVFFTILNVMRVWILPNTKQFALTLLFLLPIYMITRHGLLVIGRFAEFVYLGTLWMPLILLFAMRDTEWLNLIPIAREGLLPILKTVKATALSFLGFELALFYYPFLRDKKKAYKGIIIANTLSMIIFLLVTLLSYIRFSQPEIMDAIWPTLNLLKLIQFPFLERLEIVFLSFYLFVLFMTVIPYLYVSVFGTSYLLGRQDHRAHLRIVVFIWIVISCWFVPDYDQVTQLQKVWGSVGLFLAFLFPLLLWLYSRIYGSWRKEALQ